MTDVQHIIDDLVQVNTTVRHTALELKTKFSALVDTLEAQGHEDAAAVKDLIETIVQAAHSTASGPVLPEPAHQPVSILNPPVDQVPEPEPVTAPGPAPVVDTDTPPADTSTEVGATASPEAGEAGNSEDTAAVDAPKARTRR